MDRYPIFIRFPTSNRKLRYFFLAGVDLYSVCKGGHFCDVWKSGQAGSRAQGLPKVKPEFVLIDVKMGVGRSQHDKTARHSYSLTINLPHAQYFYYFIMTVKYRDLISNFDTHTPIW